MGIGGSRLDPESQLGWCFEAQRSLDALGMAGLRVLGLPLRIASMSSYVGTRCDGRIERHTRK